jgi:flagellar basal-body rod protein FlgC
MSLFAALSVSASGMSAQRTRAELLAENLANAETTRTPEGGPYRRKDAVFATEFTASPFASVFEAQRSAAAGAGPEGVGVADIVVDDREPERRYLPGHPDADAQGYVAIPAGESGRRYGGPDGFGAELPGQHSRHIGRQRHDPALHGSFPVDHGRSPCSHFECPRGAP